jgi:hypothetical protein
MGLPRFVIPRLAPGAFMGTFIKARSASDGIAPVRDPSACAEGLYAAIKALSKCHFDVTSS